MSSTIIKIQNLSKSYTRKAALWAGKTDTRKIINHLNLDIIKGECLALIGQSGGGKSTLGRCILRLDEPDSGSIFFNDIDLISLTGKQLRQQRPKIQMIYQDTLLALNPRMNIAASLTEPIRVLLKFSKKKALKRAEGLLESVGLNADILQRLPKELSGGQRQRVSIARALSTNPEFLIADEPTSSLDAKHKDQIIELLKDLQSRYNLTLLLISHDLSMVSKIANRVAVMQNGEIVEIASLAEFIHSPKHTHSQELVATVSA